jgi:hypothetical protein
MEMKTGGGLGLEIILIFINIHEGRLEEGKGEYHSFENVKINIINDIVFIIVLRSFLSSIQKKKAEYVYGNLNLL